MSLPAYPAYKDSGVEWLGVVPDHWAVTLLKRGYEVVLGKMLQPEARRDDDEFLPYLRAANIQLSGVDTVDVKRMWFGAEEKKSLLLRRGDLLVSEGGDVGRSAIWDFDEEECYFQNSINRIRSIGGNNTRFLYFWMLAIKKNGYVDVLCNKSTIAHFTAEKVAAVPLPIPTKSEQAQIARFLDHETARIDALIKEQRRLIGLLKEKRQAVISHAVTKGLDPTVPMKDSGVEWLGEVPAHWVVCGTRRAIRFIEQGWSPECESYPADEDGWGVLKAGCVNRGFFDSSENKTLPSTLKPIPEYEVRAGDILMSRASGSPELVGSTALLGQVRERLMLSDKIFRVHLEEKISSQFFVWVMNAQFMRSQIEQALSGGNGLANNLPQSSLLAFWLAIPPEHEQGAITELINEQTGRIDELIAEGDLAIELLQERRSALISAAVTGKIDVRGWQPPASAPSPELAKEAV
ncbi:restriction endonuclease subunit S [Pseudomonas extremorientalis]|uniref:restriction endonuclease subunit S n=1 Tax=Pseudomonas extremorientalis TaxID=169669 RepID=UPI00273517A3|nr:restriction endonuclease subunit S [Pseudomonas extremorientalis]WLG56110.1 restriction endonuclease subunit S [Pseudomonas extremorientalis]